VLVAGANAGLACAEYPPATVKQSVCGYGRADKEQVGKMVRAILGLTDVPAPNHVADALAVAICHALAPPLALHAAGLAQRA
jgi:crossover junction endodeoxyribonuclease RuvC